MKFIDLFAGIGGFRKGMELAGHECVGFCEFDKYATASYTSMHLITDKQREELGSLDLRKRQKEILKDEYRNGEWYAKDIREVTGSTIPRADCWCFGAPCFVKGTLITTHRGRVPIEDVQIGDQVLTHKSRFKPVIEKMINYKDNIYLLKVMFCRVIKCTGNHRFYIKYNINGDFTKPEWKSVEEFNGKELILMPDSVRLNHTWVPVEETRLLEGYKDYVYNLEVEDDHSYTAEGLAAHNCQDFSIAGKRAGLKGNRSSLIGEVFRILGEIEEESRPEWIIYENVKGMFSSNRGFDYLTILLAMESLGYDPEWQLFNSKDFGVPQNRERVYTVGHLRRYGEQKIFPITETDGEDSVCGVKQIGQRNRPGRDNLNQYRVYDTDGIAPTLNKMDGGGMEPCIGINVIGGIKTDSGKTHQKDLVISSNGVSKSLESTDYKQPKMVGINVIGTTNPERHSTADIHGIDGIMSTCCGRDYKQPKQVGIKISPEDISSDGGFNQRGTVHSINGISRTVIGSGHSGNESKVDIPLQFGIDKSKYSEEREIANILTAREDRGVSNQKQESTAVAVRIPIGCIDPQGRLNKEVEPSETAPTLRAESHGNNPEVVLPVLTPDRINKRQNGRRFKENREPAFTLTAQDKHGVAIGIEPEPLGVLRNVRSEYGKEIRKQYENGELDISRHEFLEKEIKEDGVTNTIDSVQKDNYLAVKVAEGEEGKEHPGIYVELYPGCTVYAVWYKKYECYIAVRKLTPKECFRLQGWTDDYFEKAEFVNSNSQLYRQAGNGVTVNVVYEIAKRLS